MRIYGTLLDYETGVSTEVEPDEWVLRLAIDIPDLEYIFAKCPGKSVTYTIFRDGDHPLPEEHEIDCREIPI
jgi:hypothetical protein